MIEQVNVNEIVVEDRVRQNYGWLDSLERSIAQLGVLQPIGITPDKRLIFGGRRLQACKNIGIETMPARIIDVEADDPFTMLRMEQDENEQRKDFTASERVEIARRIEESLAGRQGRPPSEEKENPQNFAELPKGESRDIAAEAVGWNRETYRQAKAVVDSEDREVVEQMDRGEKSVHAAYKEVRAKNKPESNKPKTFKVTLYNNPQDDAEAIFSKVGRDYSTQLAIALLNASGHNVESIES